MLKAEVIKKIAALLKIKEDDFTKAIKDEQEVDVTLPELTVFTETELKTLKDNEYNRGKEVGPEMAVKEIKEKLKLDFSGKSIDALLEAYSKKTLADAKIEPEKQVAELQKELENVRNTAKELETKLQKKDEEFTGIQTRSELYKHIPKAPEGGPAVGADDVITLMQANGYEFKMENGALVPYLKGEKQLDKLSQPKAAKEVIDEFIKAKNLFPVQAAAAGRGSGNGTPSAVYKNLGEIKAEFQKQGKSTLGQDFMKAVQQAKENNEHFDMTI